VEICASCMTDATAAAAIEQQANIFEPNLDSVKRTKTPLIVFCRLQVTALIVYACEYFTDEI